MGIRLLPTTYGRPALDALAAEVTAAKGGDPMAAVTILVPNNIAGIVARRHLATHASPAASGGRQTGVAALEVTTLRRLAERLAAHRLTPRRPATRPLVAAAWRRSLAEDPGVFVEVAEHPATVLATNAAHRELRGLSPEALAAVEGTNRLTRDVVRLHHDVAIRLDAWYDEIDLQQEAVAALTEHPISGAVLLYLPQDLTRVEADVVRSAALAADLVVIAALTGVRRADRAVHHSLELLGLSADHDQRPPVASRIVNASDSDDEVHCVVRDLMAKLQQTPAQRVAVLYANSSPYARLLHEQLGASGIKINGPGTRPITERALVRALLETLDLRRTDVARADLFRAIGNVPTKDFTGERIPLSRWERLSREAGVIRGDDWTVRLDAMAEGLHTKLSDERAAEEPRAWLVDKFQKRIDDTRALQAFATRLRAELAAAESLTTWRELSDWCLALHSTLFGTDTPSWLPPEEQYAAAAILPTLTSLAGLDQVEAGTSLDALRNALDAEFSTAVPRVGRYGEGVFVGPVSAAIGLDLDVVYVLGLSEDVYPGRLHEDPLLPEAARTAAAGELAMSRDRLDAKHRHLLAAFACAGEVVASFPRGDLRRSARRLPSRFLLPSLRAFAGDTTLAATRWTDPAYGSSVLTARSYSGELLTTDQLASEQEWRTRQVSSTGSIADPTYQAADKLLADRGGGAFTRFDGNLSGSEGLPNLLAGDQSIAPTTLESYASCPHAYFVSRLLGVQPVEEPENVYEISPMEVGNFMHEVLDELIKEFEDELPSAGQPWTSTQRSRMRVIAAAKAEEFERAGRTGHARLWRRAHNRILADLEWMLDDDDAWRAEVGAAVVASELPFGKDGREPVAVTVPGGNILMRGSADKVDVGADGTVYVTDLKTGGRSSFKDIGQDDPIVRGTKLQLPVYALAARERFGTPSSPVRAAYWFVRKDRGRIELDLTPEVEAAYGSALAILARSIAAGLFPGRAPDQPDFLWVQCPYCNPDGMGHADRRRQWEAKAADPALADYLALVEPESVLGET